MKKLVAQPLPCDEHRLEACATMGQPGRLFHNFSLRLAVSVKFNLDR